MLDCLLFVALLADCVDYLLMISSLFILLHTFLNVVLRCSTLNVGRSILYTISSLPYMNWASALHVGVSPTFGGPKNSIVPI